MSSNWFHFFDFHNYTLTNKTFFKPKKYSFIESVPVKLGMHLRGQYSTELLLTKNVGQGSRSSKKILKHKSCFLLHKAILKLIFITQSVPFFLRNTNVCFTELQQIWAIKSNFSQASKKVL